MAATIKTSEERKAILAQRVATEVSLGKRIESQTDTMAVLVKGKRVNHLRSVTDAMTSPWCACDRCVRGGRGLCPRER